MTGGDAAATEGLPAGDAAATEGLPAGDAAPARSLHEEFRDAVTVRAVFLVVGVALIQLAFITSYVGAFHRPVPHRMPIAVVAPVAVSARLVAALNGIAGSPLAATVVPSESVGTRQLLDRSV